MKRALVISGGGSKGAFAVGALQGLRQQFPALRFDVIVGTSTGALIAPLAALNELQLLEELYTTHTTGNIVTKHRLGDRITQKSIYGAEPLWQLIKKYITAERYAAIKQTGTAVYITATCLQTAELVVYTTNQAPQQGLQYSIKTAKDSEHFRLAVLGSACQPVFMPPVKIDTNYANGAERDFQYVDGGVREYAGVQLAIDGGATEIFCILLSAENSLPEPVQYNTLFPILERTISLFSEDVAANDLLIPQLQINTLQYLNAVKQRMRNDGIPETKIDAYFKSEGNNGLERAGSVKLFIIRPDAPLGGGPGGLIFDPAEMKGMVAKGKTAAQDFVATLAPEDITWLV